MAQWPLALTGSYWLQVSIIVGAIAVAIRMRPPLARVGALFAVLWIVLLAVWTGANLGIMAAFSLSPIYFFLMMYPFWAFFSLYAGFRLIEITTSRFVPKARSADPRLVCAALCVAAVALIPLFQAEVSRVFKWGGVQSRAATPITQALRENIALRPGQTYRGSVATLLGSPGSPLRRQLLVEAEQPLKPYEFERFLQKLAADTGSTHDLLDLWWLDIPTLSEYGQGLCSTRSSCSSGSWISGCDGNSVSGATADAACATPRMSAHSSCLNAIADPRSGHGRSPRQTISTTIRRFLLTTYRIYSTRIPSSLKPCARLPRSRFRVASCRSTSP
jgi:hypothetical protein